MKNEQTLLLLALAKKLKSVEPTKEAAIESLFSAGIITKTGEISKAFPNLERVLTAVK